MHMHHALLSLAFDVPKRKRKEGIAKDHYCQTNKRRKKTWRGKIEKRIHQMYLKTKKQLLHWNTKQWEKLEESKNLLSIYSNWSWTTSNPWKLKSLSPPPQQCREDMCNDKKHFGEKKSGCLVPTCLVELATKGQFLAVNNIRTNSLVLQVEGTP